MSPSESPPAPPITPAYLIPLAWWLAGGLATVELLAVTGVRLTTERFLWLSPQILWMTPAGYVLALTMVALPLALLGRWWPRGAKPVLVVTALAWPGFVSILLVYPRLTPLAVAILAAGLSVQLARWIVARPPVFHARVRRTGWWVLGAVTVLALGQNAAGWMSERLAVRRLPALSAPNILVIILDTVRAANLSLYGYQRSTTPNLEALARRGVVFDLAIAPSSWTLPSHATAFTGRPLHEHGASWRTPVAPGTATLAEVLRARGYVTGGFVANILYCGYETGLDRGFIRYDDYRVSPGEFVLGTAAGRNLANHPRVRSFLDFQDIVDRKDAPTITREFLDWQADTGHPFFAFLNFLDAHEPYASPPEFESRFGSVADRVRWWYRHQLRVSVLTGRHQMSDAQQQAELNAYDGAIAYLDYEVGRLLDSLDARGVLENTIVVVTSDHGEHFGENGKFGHGNGLNLAALHVPLLVAYGAGVPPGRRVEGAVGLDDLPATLWELAGLNGPSPLPGRSLVPTWRDGEGAVASAGRTVRSEFVETPGTPVLTSLVADGYQYIHTRWADSIGEELYDLAGDPLQEANLADAPAHAARVAALRRLVDPTR